MARNRVFFPQAALDAWIVTGAVELRGQDLVLKTEARAYRMAEGLRIVAEVSGERDQFDIVGKCKTLAFVKELGAEILHDSMIIDNNAYDIVPGFLCTPMGSSEGGTPNDESRRMAIRDDEVLAKFIAKNA